jgi:hypothetical protein
MITFLRNQDTLWTHLWNQAPQSNNDPLQKFSGELHKPRSSRIIKRAKKQPMHLSDYGIHVNWVSSVQLCMWDNILGPQVEQVCQLREKEGTKNEIQ